MAFEGRPLQHEFGFRPRDSALQETIGLDFSMVSPTKRGSMVILELWPNAFGVNMP